MGWWEFTNIVFIARKHFSRRFHWKIISIPVEMTSMFHIFFNIFSGVCAGSVWCKVWPDHAENIIVVSSLYEASIEVRKR